MQAFRSAVARATNEKVHLFRELGRVILDPEIADAALRPTIYQRMPPLVLRRAVEEADRIGRPRDESYFAFLETRYSYLRQFAPPCLETFTFHSNRTPDPRLEAVALLQDLHTSQRRSVPDDAPIDFVPLKWRP